MHDHSSVRGYCSTPQSALHQCRRFAAIWSLRRAVSTIGATLAVVGAAWFLAPHRVRLSIADFWRRSLGYVGLGWCEPYSPPYEEYKFAPNEGPGLQWPGDAEFWRNFPCARESYRVVLPEGDEDAATTKGSCRSMVVTGLFDIGRSAWVTYARPKSGYISDSKLVLSLPNPMVIFTSPELVDSIVAQRREHGFMGRTAVFAMSPYCIPYAWLLEPITRTMCSPSFSAGSAYSEIPERQQPFYNLVMYAKTMFVKAAATLPHAALNASYITWLDLGCHPPMCNAKRMTGVCLDPSPWSRDDRIRIAITAPQSPAVWAQDDVAWAKAHHVHMAGTIFGTGRRTAAALADTFADALSLIMARGMLCYDQTIFTLAYRRWPERFDPFFVIVNNWVDIVKVYSAQLFEPPKGLPIEWHTEQGHAPGQLP